MATKFSMTRDINGYNGFGLIQSDTKYGVLLAQNVEQNVVVGGFNARYLAIFAYEPGTNTFVVISSAGTLATVFTGSLGIITSELNPVAREVKSGDTISIITPDANANVGISLYAIS